MAYSVLIAFVAFSGTIILLVRLVVKGHALSRFDLVVANLVLVSVLYLIVASGVDVATMLDAFRGQTDDS
ncbi:MAG: hypothetical protein AAF636_21405 [Pseudomonadota bacterium]